MSYDELAKTMVKKLNYFVTITVYRAYVLFVLLLCFTIFFLSNGVYIINEEYR